MAVRSQEWNDGFVAGIKKTRRHAKMWPVGLIAAL